ncbi:cytochrome c oxidase subunit I [Hansschlegelia sp.]|uniref:cytochrome c oxidase subunit I n=1 Tax=Hansschlegelia sp. TaxID=2041892 RepID=UPI002CF2F746|nr:cytochrome c oxidase subunit I [Hansschlegelia sp.]HVI28661.1 cytochrome c oxidase subunit I [Hansschlegelia sp.]
MSLSKEPDDGGPGDAALALALGRTWARRPGLIGALSTVDHKVIGLRLVLIAFSFLLLGGCAALVMRLQLAGPSQNIVGADFYNQLFTMHGTTMMFLFAVPVMEAAAVLLVPLVVGARAIAFPRLVAFAQWMLVAGGVLLWGGFALNLGADVGWFSYVPLASLNYSPTKRADLWAQTVTFTELSALAISVSTIVTIFKQRAPGMSLDRVPLFAWAQLVTSFMTVFAMPGVMLASTYLILDRLVGTQFFNPAAGGDALLWQHLFWWFGHPEVYIIFVPATGFVSAIVPVFARRPMFGHTAIVLSLVSIAILAFGLWVHHMFATGLPRLGESFFTASSMAIAIPSGIQIFCWIATIWLGRPVFRTPFLFVLGFIILFVMGGLTGVMVASVPLDLQVHDTYFVVAHFHYVLIGGAVFPLLAAVYYWFPKVTGRMLSERIGRWHFWTAFIGFNVAFFPMHLLGLQGMTRRIYTYPAELGWGPLNLLSSCGAFLFAGSFALMAWNVVVSLRSGEQAGPNPWDADGLEWATSSPPPPYNFLWPPVVQGREPLWASAGRPPAVTGHRTDMREVLITSIADAVPETREPSPDESIWPFVAAVVTTILLTGSIFTPWAVVWGAPPVAVALIAWFWPKGDKEDEQ